MININNDNHKQSLRKILTSPKPLFKVGDKFTVEVADVKKTLQGYVYKIRGKDLWLKETDISRFDKIE